MGAVKAIGRDAALRVAEIERTRKGVGPNGQPAQKVGRSFDNHQLTRWPRKNRDELARNDRRIPKHRWRVTFPDRVEVKIRHIEVARAVHGHAVRIAKPRGAPSSVSSAVEAGHSA